MLELPKLPDLVIINCPFVSIHSAIAGATSSKSLSSIAFIALQHLYEVSPPRVNNSTCFARVTF